tara:strand:+ start:190 stop:387 length:198 start_codon:yes stop_codon:yes gene_type:complete
MGLITKGMGVVLKHIKKGTKRIKEDAPFYGAVGAVVGGRAVYNKIKGNPSDLEVIKKVIKKVKKK